MKTRIEIDTVVSPHDDLRGRMLVNALIPKMRSASSLEGAVFYNCVVSNQSLPDSALNMAGGEVEFVIAEVLDEDMISLGNVLKDKVLDSLDVNLTHDLELRVKGLTQSTFRLAPPCESLHLIVKDLAGVDILCSAYHEDLDPLVMIAFSKIRGVTHIEGQGASIVVEASSIKGVLEFDNPDGDVTITSCQIGPLADFDFSTQDVTVKYCVTNQRRYSSDTSRYFGDGYSTVGGCRELRMPGYGLEGWNVRHAHLGGFTCHLRGHIRQTDFSGTYFGVLEGDQETAARILFRGIESTSIPLFSNCKFKGSEVLYLSLIAEWGRYRGYYKYGDEYADPQECVIFESCDFSDALIGDIATHSSYRAVVPAYNFHSKESLEERSVPIDLFRNCTFTGCISYVHDISELGGIYMGDFSENRGLRLRDRVLPSTIGKQSGFYDCIFENCTFEHGSLFVLYGVWENFKLLNCDMSSRSRGLIDRSTLRGCDFSGTRLPKNGILLASCTVEGLIIDDTMELVSDGEFGDSILTLRHRV